MTYDFEDQVRRRLQVRAQADPDSLARLTASIGGLPARRRRFGGLGSARSVALLALAAAGAVGIALILALAGGGNRVSPSPSEPRSASPTFAPSPSAVVSPSPSGGSPAPAVTPGPAASPAVGDMQTFDEGGITFAYPMGWREYPFTSDTSMSSQFAYLVTANIPELCPATPEPSSPATTCPDPYQLTPGSMGVSISNEGDVLSAPGLHRPAGSTALTVDGLPAYFQTVPAPGVDLGLSWAIARPGSVDNYYVIDARLRGPGLDQMRRQLEALIASLRYDPPVIRLPIGSAAALAAEQSALATLVKESPVWGCFSASGPHSMVIASMPNGPALARPQLATCTMKIEATPLQFWRMTMTIRLSKPDPNAGTGEVAVQWVSPDGSLGSRFSGSTP